MCINGRIERAIGYFCCIFSCIFALGGQKQILNEHHKTESEIAQEQAIVESAKANPARFGLLYEKYYKPVFVFVFRRVGEEEIAADIVSNTFLKAMLALPKYIFRGLPFSAFLFRIAMNEINMYYRKTERERLVSLDQSNLGQMIAETGETDSKENQHLLLKVLGTLATEEMQLLELRFFEKRAFAEVGEIMGITENNAKVRTYRILEKLKAVLIKAGGR
jgi:RNA polymerase sigma-70 factor, ECF subfamily